METILAILCVASLSLFLRHYGNLCARVKRLEARQGAVEKEMGMG